MSWLQQPAQKFVVVVATTTFQGRLGLGWHGRRVLVMSSLSCDVVMLAAG
jgi:hypothetical protein